MPEFILIQTNKKDVVRKLVVRAADLKKKDKEVFGRKLHDIIADGGDWCIDACNFLREAKHLCGR